jgi:predicted ATPase/DNA-binding SARP family transcriptional activator
MGDRVEIRVLGVLEVISPGGDQVTISAPKQRELLALLVAHAPHVVSTDRIVEALWDADGDRRRSLRFHVSKLRDAVDPNRRIGLIVTQAPGYRLDAESSTVDVDDFVSLVARAGEVARTDPESARPLLDEALNLWRGAPYEEFRFSDWAQPEIARLEALHATSTELLIDVDLALGRHEKLIPALESLVVEHPLRERLWRQLMIALYRSDRQPEALRAYQRARDAFGEVGTVPSDDLARLENQVLLREPGLDAPSLGSAVGNVPTKPSSFVGRDRDVIDVRELVRGDRLVTLTGPGGVGKTRLAIEAAGGLADRFGSGVWLVEFAGLEDPDLVTSQVADTLAVVEGSGRDLTTRLADFLDGRDVLLVLDNCEHVTEPLSALVTELLGRCPRLHVLVTSRRPLGADAEVVRRTAPLAVSDVDAATWDEPNRSAAVELFLDRAHAALPSLALAAGDEARVSELCRGLAGLPLAIELAAARLRMMSLHGLVDRLENQLELLTDGPGQSVGHHRAMRATMDWGYDLLDRPEQAFFRRLAVFRGGCTLETAERFHRAFPDSEGRAFQLLAHLVDASMVEPTPDDRFVMLEPIREYGVLVLDEHGELARARANHAALYREVFRVPDNQLLGPLPGGRLEGKLEGDLNNVRAALNWAIESGDTDTIVELGSTVGCLLGGLGFLEEANGWFNRVLSVTTEVTPHRVRALARGMFLAAVLHGRETASAQLDELDDVAEALDDDRWRAISIERHALFALLRDDFTTASRLWDRAAESLHDSSDRCFALSNYMEALFYTGDYDRAERVADQLAETGDRFDLPSISTDALLGRSFIAVYRGDADLAEECFDAAQRRFGAGRDPRKVPRFDSYGSMFLPAYIALLRNEDAEAERLGLAAITIARRSRHPETLVLGLVLMGLVHLRRGDPITARRYLIEVLAEASRTGLVYFQRYVLGALAATWAMIDPERGAVLLAVVETIDRRDGRTLPAPIARAVDRANEELETSGYDVAAARRRAAAMTFDEAVELAADTVEVRVDRTAAVSLG